MVRQVDEALGDTTTLVALGVVEPQPVADPDPPAPPDYGYDEYSGPVIETA
jgi:hypothetical protein